MNNGDFQARWIEDAIFNQALVELYRELYGEREIGGTSFYVGVVEI